VFLFLIGIGSESVIVLVPILVGIFFLVRKILQRKSRTLSGSKINMIAMIITIVASPVVAAALIGILLGIVMLSN
jgi:hypothetical protein